MKKFTFPDLMENYDEVGTSSNSSQFNMSTQLSAELSGNDPIRKLSTNILPYYDVVSLVQFFFFCF